MAMLRRHQELQKQSDIPTDSDSVHVQERPDEGTYGEERHL